MSGTSGWVAGRVAGTLYFTWPWGPEKKAPLLPDLLSWNAVLGKVRRSDAVELQAIADAALAHDAAARLRLGKVDFATNTRCASSDVPAT